MQIERGVTPAHATSSTSGDIQTTIPKRTQLPPSTKTTKNGAETPNINGHANGVAQNQANSTGGQPPKVIRILAKGMQEKPPHLMQPPPNVNPQSGQLEGKGITTAININGANPSAN
ncbi:unnamed protein product [Linum trigynum]|uniref:Uncharacterized protein n=1 Tax=Linum trigynum TaxID=586398 RepID=A0AAV2DV85_9ROSI